MKLFPALIIGLAIAIVVFALTFWMRNHPGGERPELLDLTAWQSMASPGSLSSVHAFLEHDCAACHTPIKGPDAASCISCHANNTVLVTNQTTAFHATVSDCRGCHIEHLGGDRLTTTMDHLVLSRIEQKHLPESAKQLLTSYATTHARISPEEAVLDCAGCHANQDPHRTLFGADCASCHTTSMWVIAEFQHPTAQSTDCAQCHQAPPSHYMMHFEMVSETVAGIEHAEVAQCFLCHQTNAWNDIREVGWYKHH